MIGRWIPDPGQGGAMTLDLDALEARARAALVPSDWDDEAEELAEACSPDRVLALVARLREAERLLTILEGCDGKFHPYGVPERVRAFLGPEPTTKETP